MQRYKEDFDCESRQIPKVTLDLFSTLAVSVQGPNPTSTSRDYKKCNITCHKKVCYWEKSLDY